MNLGLGIIMLWLGAAGLWVAFHDTTATTPWEMIQEISEGIGGGGAAASADSDTSGSDDE